MTLARPKGRPGAGESIRPLTTSVDRPAVLGGPPAVEVARMGGGALPVARPGARLGWASVLASASAWHDASERVGYLLQCPNYVRGRGRVRLCHRRRWQRWLRACLAPHRESDHPRAAARGGTA